jgi:tRNA(fMet)-specific endonuclease VapC
MYLFDTDIIIDFFHGKNPGALLLPSLLSQQIAISIITYTEIQYGIQKSKNPDKRRREFEDFLHTFDISVIPIDTAVAHQFVDLKLELEKGKNPLADFDLLIASTAIIHNLNLVTRNTKHFSRIKKLKIYSI